tara:strand:- start:3 stop:1808 length:1806 start_codon:yes stop_codon:yes gene_type:complete
MKKNIKSIIALTVLGLTVISANSQTNEVLDINNIKARVNANSYLFHNPDNGTSSYEFPASSGINSIFSARFKMLCQNANGQLMGHVPHYYSDTIPHAGPIMNQNEYATAGQAWDKVWKVNCSTIETFKNWYNCTQDPACDETVSFPSYQIPNEILNWPAHGDISKGQAWHIAPFFDWDSDGFYDPNSGDYPLIKGSQAILFIYNPMRSVSAVPQQMIEFRGLAYAYGNTNDSALNNTIFIDYEIINRSTFTLMDTHFGFDVDFDLGNASDDYIASDVSRSAFYAYNGDSNDENANGVLGYGTNLAAQGVVFLSGAFQDDDGLDNPITQNIQNAIDSSGIPYSNLGIGYSDGIIDNEQLGLTNFLAYSSGSGPTGQPNNALAHYNQSRSLWNDGSAMVFGGTGHASSGGIVPTKHMFPGNSDPLLWSTQGVSTPTSNWSEVNEANSPADRKGVGSIGPATLEPGSVQKLTIALVSARDYTGTSPQTAVNIMKERIDSVHSYYRAGITSDCGSGIATGIQNVKEQNNNLYIYPNPFNNAFTINYELENSTALLEVYNIIGEQIQTQTITQNSTTVDLSNQTNGFYFVTIIDGTNRISKKIVKQ